ncbi:MAG: preprotein translocase subunit Sec61beta [Candidatus Pacearchaeota archaeon]
MAEKFILPPSYGGITRYSDEYKSKIQISPIKFLIILSLIIIAEIILNLFA